MKDNDDFVWVVGAMLGFAFMEDKGEQNGT